MRTGLAGSGFGVGDVAVRTHADEDVDGAYDLRSPLQGTGDDLTAGGDAAGHRDDGDRRRLPVVRPRGSQSRVCLERPHRDVVRRARPAVANPHVQDATAAAGWGPFHFPAGRTRPAAPAGRPDWARSDPAAPPASGGGPEQRPRSRGGGPCLRWH